MNFHLSYVGEEFRMSVADHFQHSPDTGFVRAYDVRAARRQFQVSIILILALAAAAFALGMLVRLAPPASDQAKPIPTRSHTVHFA
jgi:hypothetical protein